MSVPMDKQQLLAAMTKNWEALQKKTGPHSPRAGVYPATGRPCKEHANERRGSGELSYRMG